MTRFDFGTVCYTHCLLFPSACVKMGHPVKATVNELLCYTFNYFDDSCLSDLANVIRDFYSVKEIDDAKSVLWKDCGDAFLEKFKLEADSEDVPESAVTVIMNTIKAFIMIRH